MKHIFAALALTLLMAGGTFAQPLDTSSLRLPNSSDVQLSTRNTTYGETGESQTPVTAQPQTAMPFSGVQSGTTPGGVEGGMQYRTNGMQYNVNKNWPLSLAGQPRIMGTIPVEQLPVFGASLFAGNFSGTYYDERNPSYIIQYGDRIGVRVWGAFNFESELTVDLLGNIFIPTVGPVKVAGTRNSAMPRAVRAAISKVYSDKYLDSYIDLLSPHPLSVFVTGYIASPGRYAGGNTDSVLFFLDMAGGIDMDRGSFREIDVMRKGVKVASVDLYEFILGGQLKQLKLQEGDVILVKKRGIRVAVNGHVRTQAWFEFTDRVVRGADVMHWASPLSGVTHVSVSGYRNRMPFKAYLTLDEFEQSQVMDNDAIEFIYDEPSEAISVIAEGALTGKSQFFVKRGTKLHDLLNYIAVDKAYANLRSIYLRRRSVAESQKAALHESLFRLEQNALTSSSSTAEEAKIRMQEAELISKFSEKVRTVEPQGVVAITRDGKLEDIYLQDGDIIVIPNMTDVVLMAGEVISPNAVIYNEKYTVEDYVKFAGGYGNNADEERVLLFKSDGHIYNSKDMRIEPGDTLMVLPAYDSKNLQFAKDLTQIFFQLAVGTRAILQPLF